MSAAGARTANRVEVPDGMAPEPECACSLCRELAACLPDVRELFRSHGRLFRENAELKIALAREQSARRLLAEQSADLQRENDRLRRGEIEYFSRGDARGGGRGLV